MQLRGLAKEKRAGAIEMRALVGPTCGQMILNLEYFIEDSDHRKNIRKRGKRVGTRASLAVREGGEKRGQSEKNKRL